ncbi:NAD-dependent epimerase/dehydratase family protein [Cellulomonas shaoxiangyii]|uniref:NAD(P)-dependent oxidoreductase n=1 Tax=Cellulomonas shaoxiangyii TaxID=2566013 RepID=A0A4P7SKA0_9CELL|nr:NAD(P)-dependent oxidoreductase [Cellulomonas shaoxiangyii]QCB93566.1 NAD(P)-dependent oxidoreductase [Cellulomonas shaoxiangyii]TGY86888.1 NAD(P)-dependent oxidoreductase [Cellulomonas shaoxiangyii]
MRIAVTGGSGKLGRTVVATLREAGHAVTNLDVVGERGPGFVRVDLTDHGQALDALAGVDDQHGGLDAVVHLAAVPAPGMLPDAETFRVNVLSTYHVLQAARRLGIRTVVQASSETVLGLPFDTPPPYVPVDEDYPGRPETAYSLSKHLGETMAEQMTRWDPALRVVSLRFSNVMDPEDYAQFPSFDADAAGRRWNLWGYIDGRDGATAVLRALEGRAPGHHVYVIASPDTVMSRPNAELLAEQFPDVPVRGDVGTHDTLLSIDKARRELGWEPRHTWRDEIGGTSGDQGVASGPAEA